MNCLEPKFIGYYLGRDESTLKSRILRPKKGIDYTSFLSMGDYVEMFVPCGKCVLCEQRKKRDMTTRICHEVQSHKDSCFITLTYNNESLPKNENLVKADVQKFLKRLRFALGDITIRYFAVGEYGSKGNRPHYHIIIFGWCPKDLVVHQYKGQYIIYRSPTIEKLWSFGFSTVGSVDPSVARYCAQYVQKKRDKKSNGKEPEFWLASKMQGGIGYQHVDKYVDDLVAVNACIMRGKNGTYKTPLPQYYINRIRDKHFDKYRQLVQCWQDYHLQPNADCVSYSDLVSKAKAIETRNKQQEKNKELHK